MQCPKCQEVVADDAVICGACDYILDTSFLGDDITDERAKRERREQQQAAGSRSAKSQKPAQGDGAFGGDALILGDVTNDYAEVFSEETGGWLDAATGAETRALRAAPVYVDASTAQLTAPDAVLGRRDVAAPPLSPFEEHVLSFFDGERSVKETQEASGLSVEDVRIAICMLHEKGLVGLRAETFDDADVTEMEAKLPAAVLAERGDAPSSDGDGSAERPLGDGPAPSPSAPPSAPDISLDEPPTQQTPGFHTAADPGPTEAARPRAPAGPPVSAVDRAKARGVYDLAMKDIQAGKLSRARMYAKLASTLDPREPKYQDLLQSWDRVVAGVQSAGFAGAPTNTHTAPDLSNLPDDVRLFKEAEQAEAAGDYRRAVTLLREAIKKSPDQGALHNRLGVVLATRLKDFTGAMSALFAAVELEPDNTNFKHNLAKVLAAAEGKKSIGNMDIDELLTGTGDFDPKKAEAIGKGRKTPWAAFKKKLY